MSRLRDVVARFSVFHTFRLKFDCLPSLQLVDQYGGSNSDVQSEVFQVSKVWAWAYPSLDPFLPARLKILAASKVIVDVPMYAYDGRAIVKGDRGGLDGEYITGERPPPPVDDRATYTLAVPVKVHKYMQLRAELQFPFDEPSFCATGGTTEVLDTLKAFEGFKFFEIALGGQCIRDVQ